MGKFRTIILGTILYALIATPSFLKVQRHEKELENYHKVHNIEYLSQDLGNCSERPNPGFSFSQYCVNSKFSIVYHAEFKCEVNDDFELICPTGRDSLYVDLNNDNLVDIIKSTIETDKGIITETFSREEDYNSFPSRFKLADTNFKLTKQRLEKHLK